MAKWGIDFVNSVRDEKVPPPPFVAHLNLHQGLRIDEVEEGHVVQTWTIEPHFAAPDSIVQGGLACTIADVSQSLAMLTTLDAYETWPTLDFHIRFVRPMRVGESVRVESKVVNKSRNGAVIETSFVSGDRKLLAHVTGGWTRAERQRELGIN
jgi:uncharacterized protein (TIGR00369 family)